MRTLFEIVTYHMFEQASNHCVNVRYVLEMIMVNYQI